MNCLQVIYYHCHHHFYLTNDVNVSLISRKCNSDLFLFANKNNNQYFISDIRDVIIFFFFFGEIDVINFIT